MLCTARLYITMVTDMMSSVLVEASLGPHGKPNLSAERSDTRLLSHSLVQDTRGYWFYKTFTMCSSVRLLCLHRGSDAVKPGVHQKERRAKGREMF